MVVALLAASPARAAEPSAKTNAAPSATYVVALASTTLAYQPYRGAFTGPQRDVTPFFGVGRYVTSSIALEVDAGVTFTPEGYAFASFVPGALWIVHPRFYTAARFVVPVHPTANLIVSPGAGVFLPLSEKSAFVAELDVMSAVARGAPDLGLALTAGVFHAL